MKVMLFGAGGQLSTDLVKYGKVHRKYTHEVAPIDDGTAEELITKYKPDVVINCGAFHNVNKCEDEFDEAMAVNGFSIGSIAMACNEVGATFIHISTDYVFGDKYGRVPLGVDHPVNPLNVYGISKYLGEMLIRRYCPKHFIVRTSALYGDKAPKAKKYGNFVKMMLKFAGEVQENKRDKIEVVCDQYTVPTYTKYLAKQIHKLKKSKEYGTYHIVCKANAGVSWFRFTREIMRLGRTRVGVYPKETVDDGIPRPGFSALKLTLPGDIPCVMPSWKEALKEYIQNDK